MLTPLSALPCFIVTAYFLLVAYGCARYWAAVPFYRHAIGKNHTLSVDGLRGFLALGVFYHHTLYNLYIQKTSQWAIPETPFYKLHGDAGVGVFFMITGFLFWQIAAGKKGLIQPWKFYYARCKRLVPAYAFSVMFLLLVLALNIGDRSLNDLHAYNIREIIFFQVPGATNRINPVYWTLKYEWLFIGAFPALAIFARGFWTIPFVIAMFYYGDDFYYRFFLCGITTAFILRAPISSILRGTFGSLLASACLICLYTHFDTVHDYEPMALCWVFFTCIAAGSSLFGLLHTRAVLFLGTISYSFYVLHCTLIYAVDHLINVITPVAGLSDMGYWLTVMLEGTLAIPLALFSYRYFEQPFLRHPSYAWAVPGSATPEAAPA